MTTSTTDPANAIVGCILGTAIGDALGLPYEGLSAQRIARLSTTPLRYRFFFGRGMVSDDTEHTCMVAQALIRSGGEEVIFTPDLARRMKWWLLGIPAGVGFATLRAVIKLWFGASPWSSGVDSAGNGPAMRSAVIGAACDDLDHVATFVTQSATLTHSDPRAEHAARAVAFAAYAAKHGWSIEHYRDQLRQRLIDDSAAQLLETIDAACDKRDVTTQAFARDVLKSPDKVGGFCNHSVPLALHAWMRHPTDLRAALEEVIRCGGDTDTNGAIAGGIIGAGVGREGMPTDLLGGIHEWPRTVAWMSELAEQTDSALRLGAGESAPRLPFLGVAARNALFLVVVLGHGLRRLFPPY